MILLVVKLVTPAPSAPPVDSSWAVVADILVPAAAILVSTLLAIYLARRERIAAREDRELEREHAEAARVAERELVEQDRIREREQIEADRLRSKVEQTFEPILGTLAWFISASPAGDDWLPQMRTLRGQAFIAQALPSGDSREFAGWFASEVERGFTQATQSFIEYDAAQEHLSGEDLGFAVDRVMHPFRSWVKNTMDLVVMWLRGSATLHEVRQIADGAAELEWDAGRIAALAEERGGARG